MLRYRQALVALIDLIMLILAIKISYTWDGDLGLSGLFFLVGIGFFVLYNLYALLVYFLFRQIKPRRVMIEVGYFLLMLLPFYFLYRFTNN